MNRRRDWTADYSDDSPDPWIDRQLREVELPEGLLERLRCVCLTTDAQLDATLRDVAPPAGFVSRLRAVAAPLVPDEPTRFDRSQAVVSERPQTRPARRSWRLAAAACWTVVLMSGQLLAFVAFLAQLRPAAPPDQSLAVIDMGPLNLVSPPDEPITLVAGDARPAGFRKAGVFPPVPPEISLTPYHRPRLGEGTVADSQARIRSGVEPGRIVPQVGWVGSDHSAPGRHGLQLPGPVLGRSTAPFRDSGESSAVLWQQQRAPVILSTANRQAARLRIPLEATLDHLHVRSLLDTQLLLETGHRLEDLLSTLDGAGAPAERGSFALATAAGPAVFADPLQAVVLIGIAAAPRQWRSADDVALQLQFDARSVLAYRVLGSLPAPLHRPAVDSSGDPNGTEVCQVTVLLELWFHGGGADTAGWAEVCWRDARSAALLRSNRVHLPRDYTNSGDSAAIAR